MPTTNDVAARDRLAAALRALCDAVQAWETYDGEGDHEQDLALLGAMLDRTEEANALLKRDGAAGPDETLLQAARAHPVVVETLWCPACKMAHAPFESREGRG